ncbi:hypothetical protein [Cognatazoarcus halotolerans]|uniref:hypothetical protein n=1 Tax=Cognatazoarcus halotolerans TaxID=2686016 RepID=UPI00135B40B9|nr:hypothetical protein [Cognatazoarcus halotolerans]MCB1898585.1 hypothetical protein [Rhodocyclaceae bacterium]
MRTLGVRRAGYAMLVSAALLLLAFLEWLGEPSAAVSMACLGERQPLVVSNQMPYARVAVDGREGYFVVDFGADVSAITPQGFAGGIKPQALPGTGNAYRDFVFFGNWGQVRLLFQPRAQVSGSVAQAGVIGTDFLSQHIYTVDYRGAAIHRAQRGAFCSDPELAAAGFLPLSTSGYYAANRAILTCPRAGGPGHCPNIPSLPIRIGGVDAVAQLDTGFDDGSQPHSLNINQAMFDALQRAGIRLQARPEIALQLSTCQQGITERVDAYRLPAGAPLEFIGGAGQAVRSEREVTLFVKRPPREALVCGGVGTWSQPAAQLGASFFADGALVVDPFSARVWFRRRG